MYHSAHATEEETMARSTRTDVFAISFMSGMCSRLEGAQLSPSLYSRDRSRLLRRMRAFASGLGASSDSTPTRLLHFSPKAAGLLSAYRNDPSWSFEELSAIKEGGVAARAFVGWAMELERVYRKQPRVDAFLRCACMGGMGSGDCCVPFIDGGAIPLHGWLLEHRV